MRRSSTRAPILAVLLLLAGPAAAQEGKATWEEIQKEGMEALRAWRLPAAESLLVRAHARAAGFDPPDERLARSAASLGGLRIVQKKLAEAETLYRQAVTVMEAVHGPLSPALTDSLAQLAQVRRLRSDLSEVVVINARIAKLLEGSKDESTSIRRLGVLGMLAEDYRSLGRFEEARSAYELVIAGIEAARGEDHVDLTRPLSELARLHRQLGRSEKALPLYRRWIAIYEKARGEGNLGIAAGLDNMAAAQMELGDFKAAEATYLRWEKLLTEATSPDNPNLAGVRRRRARALSGAGRHAEAAKLLEGVVGVYEAAVTRSWLVSGPVLRELATEYRHLERWEDGEAFATRALESFAKRPVSDQTERILTLQERSRIREGAKRFADAVEDMRTALSLREKIVGADNPGLVTELERLAALLRLEKKGEEARAIDARVAGLRERAAKK